MKLSYLIVFLTYFNLSECKLKIDERKCNLKRLCADKSLSEELDVLECMQNVKTLDLSLECQQIVRAYAKQYFEDDNVKKVLKESCKNDLPNIQCKNKDEKYILCILDQKDKIKNFNCDHTIRRLGYIITADFTLVSNLQSVCQDDLKKIVCDTLKPETEMILWNNTLDCLQKHIDSVNETRCRQIVFRLSEIQGEDMTLDTQLFWSCANDKAEVCSFLPPSATFEMIYKCLLGHVLDPTISASCQEQLLKREKLISKDFKISKGLVRACREDIKLYHCRRLVSDERSIRLAQILLCLESVTRNGSKVSQECRSEMMQHRRLLMQDYRLTPEVVNQCSKDIESHCKSLELGGKTIHCLMERAQIRKKRDSLSPSCLKALHLLVSAADAAEDWRVDPVIHQMCMTTVRQLCNDTPSGNSRVMSCLLDNINSKYMKDKCKTALVQLQYFISRDFKLDPQLYSACYADSITFCHTIDSWEKDTDSEKSRMILPCLFRHIFNLNGKGNRSQLKQGCIEEVKRVMRQRAISVKLLPEIELVCIDDLGAYCHNKIGPGEEMICLQEKYNILKPKCRAAVGNFTEAEVGDIDLNPIVKTYCSLAINMYCQEEMRSSENAVADNVMNCLIKHKNDADKRTSYKCRAAIEHFQLIMINDYHFTVSFKHACRPFVIHYCPKVHTKAQVVECLSEVIRNDTIMGEKYKISKECRYQLRTQLLQQRELVDLDPKLNSTCEFDINNFCRNVSHGNSNILACLEKNINKLKPKCHKVVFDIERQDFTDSSSDYSLLTNCKRMIKEYCEDKDVSLALLCLKKYKDHEDFDKQCRSVVIKRMLQQSLDYRLNPALQFSCSADISAFCMNIIKIHPPEIEFEGKVVKCLKVKFREGKLRSECEKQLSITLKEEALNYQLNPLLTQLCIDDINTLCESEVKAEAVSNSGQVEECLKVEFTAGRIMNRGCRLEVAELIEQSTADINVDPLLHQACILDISKYCSLIRQGSGKVLKCLRNKLETDENALQVDCRRKLNQRIQMFQNVEKLNLQQLMEHVSKSPIKKYLIIILGFVVSIIFILGIICGIMSRNSLVIKNK